MSARTGFGVDEVSNEISNFHSIMSLNGELKKKRLMQSRYWMWGQVRKQLINIVEKDERIQTYGSQLLNDISNSKMTPRKAATKIIENYLQHK
jgi:LAO/AO transport system kinase